MNGSLVLNQAPAKEPVSSAEFRAHQRIDSTDENELIDAMLKSARGLAEDYTERSFIETVWDYYLDCLDERTIYLPRGKLVSVEFLKYYDVNGQLTTFSSSNYQVDTMRDRPRIVLNHNVCWPILKLGKINSVQIQFTAGYGENADSVPTEIKLAINQLAAHWYEHREAYSDGFEVKQVPMTFYNLLKPFRILGHY